SVSICSPPICRCASLFPCCFTTRSNGSSRSASSFPPSGRRRGRRWRFIWRGPTSRWKFNFPTAGGKASITRAARLRLPILFRAAFIIFKAPRAAAQSGADGAAAADDAGFALWPALVILVLALLALELFLAWRQAAGFYPI